MSLTYARRLLRELDLPRDLERIRSERKFWKRAFFRVFLEECGRLRLEQPRHALELAKFAPALVELVDASGRHPELRLRALGNLGASHRTCGDFLSAERAYREAEELAVHAHPLDRAEFLLRFSSLRRDQGRLDEARSLVEEGIRLYRLHGDLVDRQLYGRLLRAHGQIAFEGGRVAEAIDDIGASLNHLDPRKDEVFYYASLHNLAVALTDRDASLDALDGVLSQLKKARQALSYRPQPFARAKIQWLEGLVLNRYGATRRGEALLEKAREGLVKLELGHEVAAISLDLGSLYLEEGRHRALEVLARETLRLCEGLGIGPEGLAALALWCEAAKAGEIGAGVLERIRRSI